MASLDEGQLYQRIMFVPGLTGTWKQRADQYMRALTGKAYDGSLQTGLYLLDQIKNRNFPQVQPVPTPAPTPAPTPTPVASAGTQAGTSAATEAPGAGPKFEDVLRWQDFFSPELARSSIAERTARYFNPMAEQGREGIESDFASRGLTRSSMRGKSVMDMYRDMADQEATMREQLYGQREKEAKEDYGYQRGLYEQNPTGYKPTTQSTAKYEYQYPEESPQRYAQSYRDWLRGAYKM